LAVVSFLSRFRGIGAEKEKFGSIFKTVFLWNLAEALVPLCPLVTLMDIGQAAQSDG